MARINSYWDNNGTHQDLYNKLMDLIPGSGACEDARGANRKLEKLRVASNCYYDLFNNGLCNRAAEFRRVFGFGGSVIVKSRYQDTSALEEMMDEIILDAAREQGCIVLDAGTKVNIAEAVALLTLYQADRKHLGWSDEDETSKRIAALLEKLK